MVFCHCLFRVPQYCYKSPPPPSSDRTFPDQRWGGGFFCHLLLSTTVLLQKTLPLPHLQTEQVLTKDWGGGVLSLASEHQCCYKDPPSLQTEQVLTKPRRVFCHWLLNAMVLLQKPPPPPVLRHNRS